MIITIAMQISLFTNSFWSKAKVETEEETNLNLRSSFRFNNTVQYRTLVNASLNSYTFPSLLPNTLYSMDIAAVDTWKRYSGSLTINASTLSSHETVASTKAPFIVDRYELEKAFGCYRLDAQALLVEYNRSHLISAAFSLHNLTIYDSQDHVALSEAFLSSSTQHDWAKTKYFNANVFHSKRKSSSFKVKFQLLASQSEHSESVPKFCDDFYPNYSPLSCSIKSTNPMNHHLTIHVQLYHFDKQIHTLKANYVFYRTSRLHSVRQNLYDIPKVKERKKCERQGHRVCFRSSFSMQRRT